MTSSGIIPDNTTFSNTTDPSGLVRNYDDDAEIPPGVSVAGVTIGVLIIGVGAFGNVLIILSVVLSKPLCKSSNIFMVSLAICDLFQTIMVKPLYVHTYIAGEWQFGRQVCLYALFASNLAILESILHVEAIAFFRYIIICHPSLARRLQPLRSILLFLVVLYIVPLLIVLLPTLPKINSAEVVFNRKIMFCSFVRHSTFRLGGVLKKVIFLAIAAAFLLYCYISIYRKVRESGRNVNERGSFSPSRIRREMALLKMVSFTFVAFIILYLPLSLMYGIDHERQFPFIAYFLGVVLLWLSSSSNWIIYGVVNRRYAAAYRYIVCGTHMTSTSRRGTMEPYSNSISRSSLQSGMTYLNGHRGSSSTYRGPRHSSSSSCRKYVTISSSPLN